VTFSIIFYSKLARSFTLFLNISAFLFSTSAEASPNMAPKSSQKSIVEVNVDRGGKVHLPCNIQGNPLPTFGWYRLSDSGSYYSVPSSQRVIPSQTLLLIRNVDDRDAGRWVSVKLHASVNDFLSDFIPSTPDLQGDKPVWRAQIGDYAQGSLVSLGAHDSSAPDCELRCSGHLQLLRVGIRR
jgi:Immunoglobulin domain